MGLGSLVGTGGDGITPPTMKLLRSVVVGFDAVPGIEFGEPGKVGSRVVGPAHEKCGVVEVAYELLLEGNGGTKVDGTVVERLADEFCDESLAGSGGGVKDRDLVSLFEGGEDFVDRGELVGEYFLHP